jgi:peptide-methionine (S)-S-oxide reductase
MTAHAGAEVDDMTRRMAIGAILLALAGAAPAAEETAVFAGGCFWCMEVDFEKLDGVREAVSGYAGGPADKSTYDQVSRGDTGHAEVVKVYFDPGRVEYLQLLEHFWRNIDPTVKDRQFCDSGSQYRTAIFYANDAQREAALAGKAALARSGRFAAIHTEVVPLEAFYPAEDYHQNYYRTNALRYKFYRATCGRDARLRELWGAPK